jgi:uncharacterized membrane protein YeaQ/YmgE (transglycosylase-associated protein family)
MTWVLAGAVIGWFGFLYLKFNTGRGLVVSMIIGIAGGLLGGELLGPLLSAAPVNSGDFNPLSLLTALVGALACLTITDMVYRRFGV